MPRILSILGVLGFWGTLLGQGLSAVTEPTVADALKKVRILAIPGTGRPSGPVAG